MDVRNLLMDGDQEDLTLRAAFLEVENGLKQFFKLDDYDKFSTRDQYINDRRNLTQSVCKLINACIKTSTDEDNCKAVMETLGFKTIFVSLCKDLTKERLQGKKAERLFKYIFNLFLMLHFISTVL